MAARKRNTDAPAANGPAPSRARVIWLGNGGRVSVPETAARLLPELKKRVRIAAEDFTGTADMSRVKADYAIVLGGDGSVLRAIHQLGKNQIPIIAVNVGTLAFLSSLKPDELIPFLDAHDFRAFSIQKNVLLECSLWRKKGKHSETLAAKKLAVNEVALRGGAPFNILHVELSVDGEPATTYHGDGVLISTSIGSTAHNLSSGGPIIRHGLDVVVISPLNPHTLSYRPVVDSAERTYEFRVLNREMFVVTNGDSSLIVHPGDRVVIRRADFPLQLVRLPERGYYCTLCEKLGWSGQMGVFRD